MATSLLVTAVYDGSRLAPPAEESDPEVLAWTSVNERCVLHRVEWEDARRLVSVPFTMRIELDNEYDGSDAEWRHDAAVWFSAMAQTPNHEGVCVRQHVGASFVYVRQLLDAERSGEPLDLSLGLFNHADETGARYEKGRLRITGVEAAGARRLNTLLQRHDNDTLFAAEASPFEYVPANASLLHSKVHSVVQRSIFPITDEATAAGLGIAPAVDFVRRVHAPFYNTTAGLLPGALYWTVPRQYRFTESSEEWALRIVQLALKRRGRSERWLESTINEQFADLRATHVSPAFVEAMEVLGTALCITSTSLPYTGDRVDANSRRPRAFVSAQNITPAESFDCALLRMGGDCEDLAKTIHACYYVLLKGMPELKNVAVAHQRRGSWRSPLLRAVQRALHLYVGTGNLGSVLAAALGNASATEAAREKQYVIDSARDNAVRVGAHMWYELVPQRRFAALVRRSTPRLDATAALVDEAVPDAPWTHTVPHLLLEGTGRLSPLQLPRVAYCAPSATTAEREAVARRDETVQRTLLAVVRSAKVFSALQVERRQRKTRRVPDARVNAFYRRATYAFTPYLIERGFGVTHLMWANRGERVPEQASPLYDDMVAEAAAAPEETPSSVRLYHIGTSAEATGSANVDPASLKPLSYGVNVADKLRGAPHVALLPGPPIDEVEAAAIASIQRQLKPDSVPDVRLRTTPLAAERRYKRRGERVALADSAATAAEEETFEALRAGVRELFADAGAEWPTDVDTPDAVTDSTPVLLTLFFKEYDLVDRRVASVLVSAVSAQKAAGRVLNARVYKEIAIDNIENGVLQMLCVPVLAD